MITIDDPRSYIKLKPVSGISHKGLRIAARSATVYTCNVPDRQQIAKENYSRRNYQMKKCGYSSVSYKPYESVGKVSLDNKNLILVALGQTDRAVDVDSEKVYYQILPPNNSLEPEGGTNGTDGKKLNEPQRQFVSFKTSEKLENIQSQLVKGRKLVNAVRLGFNLFSIIKEEQKRKEEEIEMEQRRKLDESRQSMEILSANSSDESDDERDVPIRSYGSLSSAVGAEDSYEKNKTLLLANASTHSFSTNSVDKCSPRLKKKLRSSVRPYSAVFSNISYPELDARESLFRQLCALNWILDAMSQDIFPPVVTPLTNCWNIRELGEEVRTSRKKVERRKQAESNWQTLLVNPSRFSQRPENRKLTRRISVHPQHILRLSTSCTSGLNVSSPETNTRRGSYSSTYCETYAGESDRVASEFQYPLQNDETGKIIANAEIGLTKAPEKITENYLRTHKSVPPVSDKSAMLTRNKSLLRKQLNHLTSSESQEIPSKKAESRVRAWVRQTRHSKIMTGPKQANHPSGQKTILSQQGSKTRFFTSALATFGALKMSKYTEQIPSDMKKRFSEVAEETKIALNDKLEEQNRKRWNTLRRKFVSLHHSLHVDDALERMRNDVSLIEPETHEEMRQRVSKECKWYKDLINTFPNKIKSDRYIALILNKLAQYGSLEGRKISASHFLKVIATLRPWELCYPEIAAAVEFVRENIVGFSVVEYDNWLSSRQQSCSSSMAP